MMALISQSLIDKYSAGPSATKVLQVKLLHTTIRDELGEDEYDTLLQGSYRNNTALADINDVDILARRKGNKSPLSVTSWERLFQGIALTIRLSSRIAGTVSIANKCVKLKGSSLNADIVPAVAVGDFAEDPVSIWSRRDQEEIPNYPRRHYKNGVAKQLVTNKMFKPTVRLFKYWARQYFEGADTAPSYYIESAVRAVPRSKFDNYLPLGFAQVGLTIGSWSRYKVINSVAEDKDILVHGEWDPDKFETFKAKLLSDLRLVVSALKSTSKETANRYWRTAFGDV